ncbi:MAG: MFS transporter [Acidimicrobiales bacterium]
MSSSDGWQPLSKPSVRAGAEAFHLSPFARLARSHAFGAAGDALVTIALANSLFFDLDPNDARWKVFLYLALTMAPLALVAPFIGPVLDRSRGGRRWMVVGAHGGRALVCLVMLNDLQSLLLFPEAFTVLALGKAYGVARSALVPTVVHNDAELVEANSKLQLLSGLAAPLAAIPALIAYLLAGSPGVLFLAMVAYLIAMVASLRVPATQVAEAPATPAETAELRGIGIVLASTAMGLIRGMVGFLTFLLLFGLRDGPTWHLGLVLGFTGAGVLVGSMLAPALRRAMSEERILLATLALIVVIALVSVRLGELAGAAAMAATIAVASTCGKLGFDSLVQRDAPDANRGRSFARFEVRFQLVWVTGAVAPVIVSFPLRLGFLVVGGTAAFALFSYLAGQRAARRSHVDRPPLGPGIPPDEVNQADASTRDLGSPVDPTWVRPHPGIDPTQIQ